MFSFFFINYFKYRLLRHCNYEGKHIFLISIIFSKNLSFFNHRNFKKKKKGQEKQRYEKYIGKK